MIISILVVMEGLASVYYFQRKYESSFAVVEIWHGVKKRIYQSSLFGQPKIEPMYVNDDRYGFLTKENSKFVRDHWGRKVTYKIGPNNERFIPKPKDSVGQILFLGGSYTFGLYVNDDETYPHILATEYWKNWEIQNMAVNAWGTSQAYLTLSELIESDSLPSMVIYGMISHHIRRNYLRRSWIRGLAKFARKLPHFELVNGDLVFQGLAGPADSIKDAPELWKKEVKLTSAFLRTMQKKCAEKDIPFIVILLPSTRKGDNYPPSLIYTMYNSNIPVLDLTELEYEGLKEDYTKHPSPMDFRRISQAIANSFVTDILVTLENSL
jgi:hypothetical protein